MISAALQLAPADGEKDPFVANSLQISFTAAADKTGVSTGGPTLSSAATTYWATWSFAAFPVPAFPCNTATNVGLPGLMFGLKKALKRLTCPGGCALYPAGHALKFCEFAQKAGVCPVQMTPRPAVLAFADTKPDGVVHWPAGATASTGRLTRVISTGATPNPPWSNRRRPANGPARGWAGGSDLELVFVGSGIPFVPVESQRVRRLQCFTARVTSTPAHRKHMACHVRNHVIHKERLTPRSAPLAPCVSVADNAGRYWPSPWCVRGSNETKQRERLSVPSAHRPRQMRSYARRSTYRRVTPHASNPAPRSNGMLGSGAPCCSSHAPIQGSVRSFNAVPYWNATLARSAARSASEKP